MSVNYIRQDIEITASYCHYYTRQTVTDRTKYHKHEVHPIQHKSCGKWFK